MSFLFINKTLQCNNLKTRTVMNAKIAVFVICVEAITYYCVCVKRKTLYNCLCSSSSCDSASLIRNTGEFGAKSYFTDYRTANTINGFRDSSPVLKIHGCYQKTQRFEQRSIAIQVIQGTCSVLMKTTHFKQFSNAFILYILTRIVW